MERIARLIGRRAPRPADLAERASGVPVEPVRSVLDLGDASVKAAIVRIEGERPEVLAYTVEPLFPGADDSQVLRAAERALVSAEDVAGAVPRGVVVGIGTAECVFARSAKEARNAQSAERGEAPALSQLRDGAFGVGEIVDRRRRLVTALDLDLVGIAAEADALALLAGSDGAIVIDAGSAVTSVVVCRSGAVEAAIALPVGGGALEERLCDRLGIGVAEAREAVVAHSAGAGDRSGVGRGAARIIGELARHHADVWVDALETGLSELGRGRTLPGRLLLCGGSAKLPEIGEMLRGGSWHTALPFDNAPDVRRVGPEDVSGVTLPRGPALGPEAVTAICLAKLASAI